MPVVTVTIIMAAGIVVDRVARVARGATCYIAIGVCAAPSDKVNQTRQDPYTVPSQTEADSSIEVYKVNRQDKRY